MQKFSEFVDEATTLSSVHKFVEDCGITNMDFKLDGKVVKFNGFMSKTGQSFDEFCDTMKGKYERKFNLVKWDKETAYFEVRI